MKAKEGKKGLTLVETLVAIAILSIIAVLGFSIFSYGPQSFKLQTNTLSNQQSVKQVLRNISKDARSVDLNQIEYLSGTLTLGDNKYKLVGDKVLKNGNEIASGINKLNVLFVENKVTVSVESKENNGYPFSLATDIYIRTAE